MSAPQRRASVVGREYIRLIASGASRPYLPLPTPADDRTASTLRSASLAHIATTLYRRAPVSLSLPLGLTHLLGTTLFGAGHTLPPPPIVRDSDGTLRRLLLAII